MNDEEALRQAQQKNNLQYLSENNQRKQTQNNVNNQNAVKAAANAAEMSGHPVASAIGKRINIADKLTDGKASEKIGKEVTRRLNHAGLKGKIAQKSINKLAGGNNGKKLGAATSMGKSVNQKSSNNSNNSSLGDAMNKHQGNFMQRGSSGLFSSGLLGVGSNILGKKEEVEDSSQSQGLAGIKVSKKAVISIAAVLIPFFLSVVLVVVLISSSQIFLTANTLGQADKVNDTEANNKIEKIKNDENKLNTEIEDEKEENNNNNNQNATVENSGNSNNSNETEENKEEGNTENNSENNNVSYNYDIYIEENDTVFKKYEFAAEKENINQEATLETLEEFYPDIIKYTKEGSDNNDVYKFFMKLYNIYVYYEGKGVKLDTALIMSVLTMQSTDNGEVFRANTVDYNQEAIDLGPDNPDFDLDKDWSDYKPTRNNSSHDMEVLAQGMVKEGNSSSSNDSSSNIVVSKTGKEAIDKMNEIAIKEAEAGNAGGQKYWSWFGLSYRDEWCAMFVSWLFNQVGGLKKYIVASGVAGAIPRESVAAGYGTWYQDECTDPSTVPAAGDVIVFDPALGSYTPYPEKHGYDEYFSSHVGYVYKVDDNYVYTVEGNAGDRVQARQYERKTHCGTYGLQGINGYFRPKY